MNTSKRNPHKQMRTNITQERLMELLHFDPQTGIFTRRIRTSNRVSVGDVAGCLNPEGYIQICVDSKNFLAHRLAWLYVHGEWPSKFIDHANGDKKDNRASNLRLATNTQNMHNCAYENRVSSGFKGVHSARLERGGKVYEYWVAAVRVGGGKRESKYFPKTDDGLNRAKKYLADLRSKCHGEFANNG